MSDRLTPLRDRVPGPATRDPDAEAVYAQLGDDVAGSHGPPITLPPPSRHPAARVHLVTHHVMDGIMVRTTETVSLGPLTRDEAKAVLWALDLADQVGMMSLIVDHLREDLRLVLT